MATPDEPKKMGRPAVYSPELAERILDELAEGKPLTQICKADWAPHRNTVLNWTRENKDFLVNYVRAREEGASALVDDVLEIADKDSDDVQRATLRINTRKWLASKHYSRLYGDKTTTELTGKDGGPIETTSPQDSLRWILFAMAAHKDESK